MLCWTASGARWCSDQVNWRVADYWTHLPLRCHFITPQSKSWYSFYHAAEDRRLSCVWTLQVFDGRFGNWLPDSVQHWLQQVASWVSGEISWMSRCEVVWSGRRRLPTVIILHICTVIIATAIITVCSIFITKFLIQSEKWRKLNCGCKDCDEHCCESW